MARAIAEGDVVNVYYVDGKKLLNVKVLNVPGATGDMWFFETNTTDTDNLIVAQNPVS